MQTLKKEGKTPEEIEAVIKKIDLPLGIHMTVMGRFSEICYLGRLQTKTERKLGMYRKEF